MGLCVGVAVALGNATVTCGDDVSVAVPLGARVAVKLLVGLAGVTVGTVTVPLGVAVDRATVLVGVPVTVMVDVAVGSGTVAVAVGGAGVGLSVAVNSAGVPV
jgi:hypothetical protein